MKNDTSRKIFKLVFPDLLESSKLPSQSIKSFSSFHNANSLNSLYLSHFLKHLVLSVEKTVLVLIKSSKLIMSLHLKQLKVMNGQFIDKPSDRITRLE